MFNLSNGFFLPLDFQSVSDEVLIKYGESSIGLTPTDINIKNSNIINIESKSEINITNAIGEMNIDNAGLIQIKNTAKSLYTITKTGRKEDWW